MGRELFDHAFKTYAQRWKFKHPTPEDFFRTMEDASGVDLDWFWRGWFFTTDYVDIGIEQVKQFAVTQEAPKDVKLPPGGRRRRLNAAGPLVYMIENPDGKPTNLKEIAPLEEYLSTTFSADERTAFRNPQYFYEVTFNKPGGLVMPLIVELTFDDGTTERHTFPAQIWRFNDERVVRTFATEKRAIKIMVDPKEETADIDTTNNSWPKADPKSKFD